MPSTQYTLRQGAHISNSHSVLVHGQSLRPHMYIDMSSVYTTAAACALTGAHAFAFCDFSSLATGTVTLPSAAAVIPYLEHARTGAMWQFYIAIPGACTIQIAPGNGWSLSGAASAAANLAKSSGQLATITCWVINPAPGSESLGGRVSWAY